MDAYNEFDDLLQICLTDGIITDQEREVLLKKAETLGIDIDEAKFLIDAAQQQFDQKINELASKQRVKTCPFCGNPISKVSEICPHCGNSITAEASKDLRQIIDNLEDALIAMKSGKNILKAKFKVDKYIRRAKMYYVNNPKVQKLLKEVETENQEVEKKTSKLLILLIACIAVIIGIVIFHYNKPHENQKLADEQVVMMSEELEKLISNNDLHSAAHKLHELKFYDLGDSKDLVDTYDQLYIAVIRELFEQGDFARAEFLLLSFRTKIDDDYCWKKSSSYNYLYSKFQSIGRNTDALESSYNHYVNYDEEEERSDDKKEDSKIDSKYYYDEEEDYDFDW